MKKLKFLLTLFLMVIVNNLRAQETDTGYVYKYECSGCGTFETVSSKPVEVETEVNITTLILPNAGSSRLAQFTSTNARKGHDKPAYENKNNFNVYPNPTTGKYFLNFRTGTGCAASVQIFSIYGTELSKKELMLKKGMNVIETDNGNLAAGNYFIKVNFNNDSFTRKIVLKAKE